MKESFVTITLLEPRKLAKIFSSLEITTDSVVAKISLVTNTATRRIYVDWGDLESDILTIIPGINSLNSSNPLPDGTYQIFHAYQEPKPKQSFERHVTVRIEDKSGNIDQRSKTITLIPKYRINVYRAKIQLLNPCDFFGSTSEFEITQTIDGVQVHRWKWEFSNNIFSESQSYVLPDSQFSTIYELGGTPTRYSLEFREKDGYFNPDDKGIHQNILYSNTESDHIVKNIYVSDPISSLSCTVRLSYDIEVSIIKSLPPKSGLAIYNKAKA